MGEPGWMDSVPSLARSWGEYSGVSFGSSLGHLHFGQTALPLANPTLSLLVITTSAVFVQLGAETGLLCHSIISC